MSDAAQRRVAVLQSHLQEADAASSSAGIARGPTLAVDDFELYSIALPEHLTADDPWLVHRCEFSSGVSFRVPLAA